MTFTGCQDPLSEEQITSFELTLGLQFPRSLREHYLRTNGGCPDRCEYEDEVDEYANVTVDECLPLSGRRRTAITVYNDLILKRALLPKHFFPFAVDPGGDYLYVDCSSKDGMVYLYHHDTAYDPLVPFNVGLDEFWSRLRLEE